MLSINKYQDVHSDIVNNRNLNIDLISSRHNVSTQVVISIISFQRTFDYNRLNYLNSICSKNGDEIINAFNDGKTLKEISKQFRVPVSQQSKFIWGKVGYSTSLPAYPGTLIEKFARDAQKKRLYFDSYFCADAYGSGVNRIKLTVGKIYEHFTAIQMNSMGLSFVDDCEMRRSRQVKTPDFRLLQSVVVYGHQVNWVEVKAGFGSPHAHKHYLPQFRGYVARYGPGLVIYYGGCVQELNYQHEDVAQRVHYEQEILQQQVKRESAKAEFVIEDSSEDEDISTSFVALHYEKHVDPQQFPSQCVQASSRQFAASNQQKTATNETQSIPVVNHTHESQLRVKKANRRVVVPTPVVSVNNASGSKQCKPQIDQRWRNEQTMSTQSATDILVGLPHQDILVLPQFPAFNICQSWRKQMQLK